jgi:hypothetical protein
MREIYTVVETWYTPGNSMDTPDEMVSVIILGSFFRRALAEKCVEDRVADNKKFETHSLYIKDVQWTMNYLDIRD